MPNDFEDRFGQNREPSFERIIPNGDSIDAFSNESMDDTSESRPSLRELIKRKQSQKSSDGSPQAKKPSIRPSLAGFSPKEDGGVNFAALIGEARKNLGNESVVQNNSGIQVDLKKARAEVHRVNQAIEEHEGRVRHKLVEEMIADAPPPIPPHTADPLARPSSMATGTTEALFGFKGSGGPGSISSQIRHPMGTRTEKSMIRRINELASSDLQERARADGRRGTSGVLRLPDSSILEEIAKGPAGPYRIRVDDLEYGPTDSSVVLRLVELGLVTGADEIAKSTWGGWERLEDHPLFIKFLERPFDRVLEEDSKIGVSSVGPDEDLRSHTANGFQFSDETKVANSSYSLAKSLAHVQAYSADPFDKESTAVEIEAAQFSRQDGTVQKEEFVNRDATLVQGPVLTPPMRSPTSQKNFKDGFTEVSVSDIALKLANLEEQHIASGQTGMLPPVSAPVDSPVAPPRPGAPPAYRAPVLTPDSERTSERPRNPEDTGEDRRNNTIIGHQALASSPADFHSDAKESPRELDSVSGKSSELPEMAFEIPAGEGEEKIAPDAVTPVPGNFRAHTGANQAIPSGFDDFVVPSANHEDVVQAVAKITGPNAAVAEVEVPSVGPPRKRAYETVQTLENQPVPAYLAREEYPQEIQKSRSPMLYVVVGAFLLLTLGGLYVALTPKLEDRGETLGAVAMVDQQQKSAEAANSTKENSVIGKDQKGENSADVEPEKTDKDHVDTEGGSENNDVVKHAVVAAAADETTENTDSKEGDSDQKDPAEGGGADEKAEDNSGEPAAGGNEEVQENRGDRVEPSPALIPVDNDRSQRAVRLKLLAQLASNPTDKTLIEEFEKSVAEQAKNPPPPTEIQPSWTSFKKLDGNPTRYLTRDPSGVEWEFIPEHDKAPTWRGDYAFYQLCGLIDCGFEVPEARLAFIPEATLISVAGDREAGKMPLKHGKVEGVLRRHLTNTVPFEIEDTSIWRNWLSRRTPLASLQTKILAVDINGGSDAARTGLARVAPTILEVARGVGNILAVDYLTNNFGRFARHRSEYGQHVRFRPEPPFILITIDNQDAFQARESTRVRGRFNWSDRLGRNFLESVRRLKPERVSEVLFPNITGAEKAAMSVFWEQRSDLIHSIERRIQSYGADDILLP